MSLNLQIAAGIQEGGGIFWQTAIEEVIFNSSQKESHVHQPPNKMRIVYSLSDAVYCY